MAESSGIRRSSRPHRRVSYAELIEKGLCYDEEGPKRRKRSSDKLSLEANANHSDTLAVKKKHGTVTKSGDTPHGKKRPGNYVNSPGSFRSQTVDTSLPSMSRVDALESNVNQEGSVEGMIQSIATFPYDIDKTTVKSVYFNKGTEKSQEFKAFPCGHCGKSFIDSVSLEQHYVSKHNTVSPCVCPICSKTFRDIASLTKHQKVHDESARSFKCTSCGKSFTDNNSLKRHEKSHSGVRPFRCTVCGKTFVESGSFRRHEKIHMGIRRFKCWRCGRRFQEKQSLMRHLKHVCGYGDGSFDVMERCVSQEDIIREKLVRSSYYTNPEVFVKRELDDYDDLPLEGVHDASGVSLNNNDLEEVLQLQSLSSEHVVDIHGESASSSLRSLIHTNPNLIHNISEMVDGIDSYEKMLDLCWDKGQEELEAALTMAPAQAPNSNSSGEPLDKSDSHENTDDDLSAPVVFVCFECGELLVEGDNFKPESCRGDTSLSRRKLRCVSCDQEAQNSDGSVSEVNEDSLTSNGLDQSPEVVSMYEDSHGEENQNDDRLHGDVRNISNCSAEDGPINGDTGEVDVVNGSAYRDSSHQPTPAPTHPNSLDTYQNGSNLPLEPQTSLEDSEISKPCLLPQTASFRVAITDTVSTSKHSVRKWNVPPPAKPSPAPSTHSCTLCRKVFTSPEFLAQHYAHLHRGCHICSVCGKAFTSAPGLKRHSTLHTGVKPYTCPGCSKQFRDPSNFGKHKQTCQEFGVLQSQNPDGVLIKGNLPGVRRHLELPQDEQNSPRNNHWNQGMSSAALSKSLGVPVLSVRGKSGGRKRGRPSRRYTHGQPSQRPGEFSTSSVFNVNSGEVFEGNVSSGSVGNGEFIVENDIDDSYLHEGEFLPDADTDKSADHSGLNQSESQSHEPFTAVRDEAYNKSSTNHDSSANLSTQSKSREKSFQVMNGIPHLLSSDEMNAQSEIENVESHKTIKAEAVDPSYGDSANPTNQVTESELSSRTTLASESNHQFSQACASCGLLCHDLAAFQRHAAFHTGPHRSQCAECGKSFPDMTRLRRHVGVHQPRPPHRCPLCGRGYSDKYNLRRHLIQGCLASTVIPSTPYSVLACGLCDRVFCRGGLLQDHLASVHHNEPGVESLLASINHADVNQQHEYSSSPGDGIMSSDDAAEELVAMSEGRSSSGADLSRVDNSESSHSLEEGETWPHVASGAPLKDLPTLQYFGHVSSTSGPEGNHQTQSSALSCQQYGIPTEDKKPVVVNQQVSPSSKSERHMKPPFVCRKCGKWFLDNDSLQEHAHTPCRLSVKGVGRPPMGLPCYVCGKGFAQKHLLTRHMSVHRQERLFPCQLCGRAYKDKSSLRRHCLVHDKAKGFTCQGCGKAFSYPDSLRRHSTNCAGAKMEEATKLL